MPKARLRHSLEVRLLVPFRLCLAMDQENLKRRNLVKRFNTFITLCIIIITLASCSGRKKTAPKITKELSFFTMQLRPTFDNYFSWLFEEFAKTHPGVRIKWLDYPAQNYETKLITSFMGKHPPDVINLTADMVPSFVQRNTIIPLDNIIAKKALDSYFPNVLKDACGYNGRIYALPWYLSSTVTMCNKKIFEEAGLELDKTPRTYEAMRHIAEVIHKKTNKFGFFPLYTEDGCLRGYLIEAGVPILDKSGRRAIFYTPKGVKVFKFWTDMYKEGIVPSEALTAMHRRPIELYKSGRLAIFHSGPQFLKHVKSDAPNVYKNTIVGPRLHWKGHEVFHIAVHNLTVAKKSPHPKLAAEFTAFVTNGENQLKFCKLTTIIPSVIKAVEDPYFTDVGDTPEGHARRISARQVRKGIVIRTPPRRPGKLNRVLDEITEKVCLGKMSADEGLKLAEKKWNEILNQ